MKDTNANWARKQIAMHGVDRYPTIQMQFIKLTEEMGELAKELNKADLPIEKIVGECADVALALYNLCDKLHVNLDQAIRYKVQGDTRKFT